MATNTYTALKATTVTGSAVSSITFDNIPQTYTDLILVGNIGMTSTSGQYPRLKFNNDSNSLYSMSSAASNGTSITGGRVSGSSIGYFTWYTYANNSSISYNFIANIMQYTNTSVYKAFLARANEGGTGIDTTSGLWRSTAAINQIDVTANSGQFSVGSTFTLYGVTAWAAETTPKATGGYVYSDSTYYYHAFPFSGTFAPSQSLSCDVLVVAGGGSGGGGSIAGNSGGGGAGGLLYFASQSISTNQSVTVGAGGSQATTGNGNNGSNSVFGSLTAAVGGGGGGVWTGTGGATGLNGGSGGGAGQNVGGSSGGTATSGQGYAGGNTGSENRSGAGGGGAGAVGGNTTVATEYWAGSGGAGTNTYSSWMSATGLGVSGYIAGGGGGSSHSTASTDQTKSIGGLGGGGYGSTYASTPAKNGTVSTGSGGGGGGENRAAGAGGSGIVIVRYTK